MNTSPIVTDAPARPVDARSFAGKRAVVTGASSGVGRALAEALTLAGCDVTLIGRNRERLAHATGRLRADGGNVRPIAADLTEADDLSRTVDTIRSAGDSLDLLIHSAGIITTGPLEAGGRDDFERQFACNVRVPYLLTQALLPLLRTSRGQVVFLNSTAGLSAKAGAAIYSASKHALKALADGLRDEVNADGIRVMSVFLGRTDTPMQQEIFRASGLPYDGGSFLQPEDVATVLLPLLQLPPSAEVTEFVLRPLRK